MATIVLPVRNDFKRYEFQTGLEGVTYRFSFGYNTRASKWFFNISDVSGNQLLADIPVLINIPLTDQYINEELPPGRFIAIDETGQNREPGIDNFGTEIKFLYQESTDG